VQTLSPQSIPGVVLLLLLAAPAAPAQTPATPQMTPAPAVQPPVAPRPNRAAARGVHDPSIIKAGGTWYVFGSGGRRNGPQLPILCAPDPGSLAAPSFQWTRCGFVFPSIPAWIVARLPGVQDLWAPDISYVDGEYRVYYAYSLLGKNSSGIALVTNKTLDRNSPDYAWIDRGTILESHYPDDFNAIDPNFIRDPEGHDAKGNDWLVFGSFWTGIKMRRLAPDGTLSKQDKKTYSLARRAQPPDAPDVDSSQPAAWQAIEGPFLFHHGDYFYLFTSWDHCCAGAASNYHIVVGRSREIKGPYLDEDGKKLSKGGGTTILAGNDRWAGPGGQSVYQAPDGTDLIVFHAYDRVTGAPWLQVSVIHWVDDWPQVQFPAGALAAFPGEMTPPAAANPNP
jgi:arabinan endo-1,5-alpha-L-arabinosidase